MNADRITFSDNFADALTSLDLPIDTDRLYAPFALVPVADLARVEPAAPSYWWEGYLPAGVLTLLGAHGGTGKSFVALMLAICIAMGLPLFGTPTRRGIVCYFSGEDAGDVLRHRLKWICAALGVDPAELGGRLHILDATAGEPVLFHEISVGGRRHGTTTATYEALQAYVEHHGIDVLMIDNASDALDASENDRARVRAFVRALVQLIQARAGAVLLLAHVDKGTSRGDRTGTEAYSGSTAWHNSARSRLYLSRDKDGALLLEHHKNTHGAMREPVRLVWPKGGVPHVDQAVSGIVQHISDGTDTKMLLTLLHRFYGRGEFVSTDIRSRYNAVKVLGDERTFPKRKPPGIFGLLRDAEYSELIQRETYRDRNRKEHERWVLTASGCEHIGAPAPSAPSAPSTEHGAHRHTARQGAPSAPCSA
jgi:putative DNA primase/helicase